MKIQMPYGRTFQTAFIPDQYHIERIDPPDIPATEDPVGMVYRALENLVGDLDLDAFRNARSVAIAINDKTRPVPHHQLLPPLLEKLAALGIPDASITFYVAVGTHMPMPADEFSAILPSEILNRYRVVSHDSGNPDKLKYLGDTVYGTQVWSNKAYAESDFKIVVGNIEPHQFAGFSGGVKTAAIGLSGLETINHNHALLTHPRSQLGKYNTNPVRQEIEDIGEKICIQLALNAILNQDKEIVHVLAGDPVAVMQSGIELSQQVCQVCLPENYDLVIASPGGHPKDINLYQAQKGLAHAALVTESGGTVILAAACPEGTGSPHYEEWMLGKTSYQEVIDSFCGGDFRIGPHKAYQIARDASRVHLLFCSEMPEDFSRALLLNPVKDLQSAVDLALVNLKPGGRIGVMTHASSTIPLVKDC